MILRALIATWLYFQVINVIDLDLTTLSFGHHVKSEISDKQAVQDVTQDFYASYMANCSDDGNQNESACATCGCSTGIARLALPQTIECEISEDVLHEIYQLVLEAFKKINYLSRSSSPNRHKMNWVAPNNDNSCDGLVDNCRNSSLLPPSSKNHNYLENANEACEELLEDMKYMIRNITAELDLLLDLIDDPELLRIRIRQLQECVSCLQTKIDVIVKQAATEIAQCYETGLGQVTTCFATQLDERTKKIQQLEEMVTLKTVNVAESYVLAGKYVEAALTFRDLKNESLFDKMMENLWESRQLEQILQFSRALYHNNITGRTLVYTKLMSLMENSVPIDTHQVIFYSFVTRDRIDYCGTIDFCFPEGLPFDYATITKFIKPKTDEVISKWVSQIRNDNYKSLILFGSPEVKNFTGVAFHEILGDLIIKAYDKNSANLGNTLNFASALRWNNQSFTAFDNLLKQAKETGRLDDQFKIGIRMKDAMENLNGPDEEQTKVKLQFEGLMKSLPDNIRALVFEETCTLQSVYNNDQYLIADGNPYYQAGNRRVVTQPGTGGSYKWKFERIEKSPNNYEYRIKNDQNSEYLGSHIPWRYYQFNNPGFDVCCTSTPDYIETQRKYYNWEVHFDSSSSSSANEISLYHVGRGAYLYAHPDSDVSRRWVVLGMSGLMSSNTRWKIACE